MNASEAQLALHEYIADLFVDLTAEDDEEDMEGLRDSMNELTEMLLDSLDLTVVESTESDEGIELAIQVIIPKL